MLAVDNLDRADAPLVLPAHFTVSGEDPHLHLARPTPVWRHLEAAAEVRMTVTGDYAPGQLQVEAKSEYGDDMPVEHRERVTESLEHRGHGLDPPAATQQRRRLAAIGDWQTGRDRP